ncbi:MAG: hypothetical protein ACKO72_03275 [Actinomycetes bacterium]
MTLDLASVLLQWGVGILAFLYVTSRGRLVSLGYGWLLRAVGAAMLAGGLWALLARDPSSTARDITAVLTGVAVLGALGALAVSVVRRGAGVRAARERAAARAERVAAMAGGAVGTTVGAPPADGPADGPEFPPALDLVAPIAGAGALLACAATVGGPYPLAAYRLLVGAAFLGVLTDAMLLGHWYLTQPGLPREPIRELVRWAAPIWVLEVIGMLWPIGMVSVLIGSISDGYGGILAWMWAISAASTGVLVLVTWLALKERSYSAVMAATGLLYLAILTGFGTDVLARALLAP